MTQISPSSDESTLFVPMHIDALVMNETLRKSAITYNRWQMDYDQMNQFDDPKPDEFVGQVTDPPPAGVHLHWTLPEGLSHGIEKEGDIEFPFAPNRWLVVRIPSKHDDNRPNPAAWVIISDAYGEDCTNPYLDPRESAPGKIIPTGLGKKVPLADWHPKPDEEGEPFLKAIAPGNITFAAFAPGVENVFGFHDDLKDFEKMDAVNLTYLVVGWYSQPQIMDPLLYNLPQNAWQCKFLFNISSEFQKELDQHHISDVLRQVFKDNGIELSPDPTVLTDQPGSEWRVMDKGLTYTARKADKDINVYESTLTVADHLRWAVKLEGKLPPPPPPTRTLVHGMVYGVEWKPEGELSKPINIPDKQTIQRGVRIAVGNTSVDALAALIQNQAKEASQESQIQTDFLEAFQYDLLPTLDQVGSKTLLEQQIRQHWFGSDPGGILWTIMAKERANEGAGQELPVADTGEQADQRADQKPPKISPEQERRLAEINKAQHDLDAEHRILASMQWELYALWWKSKRIDSSKDEDLRRYSQPVSGSGAIQPPKITQDSQATNPSTEGGNAGKPSSSLWQLILKFLALLFGKMGQETKPIDNQDKAPKKRVPLPQALDDQLARNKKESFAHLVKAQREKVEELAKEVKSAKDRLYLDPEQLVLKPSRMPRFWHPNDPVVLISGLDRQLQQGQAGDLLCRLSSQLIDAIAVLDQDEPLSADDYKDIIKPLKNEEELPSGVNQLYREAFFLDPGNAEIIASHSPKSPVTREAVEKAILEIMPTPLEGTSVIGRYGALEWEQPWSPLFLDWQVSFSYTCEQQDDSLKIDRSGNFVFDRESWHFDGTDASWTREDPQHRKTYSGRTFLTPHAPLTFLDRLQKYLQSQPDTDLKIDEAFLKKIADWDILSQTLSGFSEQLILRDLEYTVLPNKDDPDDKDVAALIDDQHQGIPFMKLVEEGMPFFFPLRAGFLKFKALRIIDKFGRTLNLMFANNNPSGKEELFHPIGGRGMVSSRFPGKGLVELPPRVVQNSRLNFRFVSAKNDQQETGLAFDTNPVCGWFLPNHIDKSISVYAADGNLLGEISLVRKSKEESIVSWQPAPGAPEQPPASTQQDEIQIDNPHLKKVIEGLVHRGDQGAAYSNLLQVIDESLWTIDQLSQHDDQNLSVLIGRPMAIVRANLQLELMGNPFYNQAWHETFADGSSQLKKNSGGVLDIEFPVRLGSKELRNDGLIGYFQGSNYSLFHAVHCPDPASLFPANPPYICKISENDDYIRLKFKGTTLNPLDPKHSDDNEYLTMLIDPRCVIHANSGLLPTKVVQLPDQYVSKAIDRMAITFRSGPLLLEPETIRLPLPAEQHGSWTWVQAKSTKKGEWQTASIVKADAIAHLSTPPLKLVEGWLKFSPDDE